MGDADESYDFRELPKFVDKLRQGYDLAQGCRLPAGGGTVRPGAMPRLHRWWGNPMFSAMVRTMFWAPVHDVYCGMRGFRKDLFDRLDLRSSGMEFATEMVIKSSLHNARIAEVPITLHPDGRKAHAPHLKTFRDGWRTLRFFLMYSPRWLFLYPGLLLLALGAVGYALALPGHRIGADPFRRAHAAVLEPGDPARSPVHCLCHLREDRRRWPKACCRPTGAWRSSSASSRWSAVSALAG